MIAQGSENVVLVTLCEDQSVKFSACLTVSYHLDVLTCDPRYMKIIVSLTEALKLFGVYTVAPFAFPT